MRIARLNVSINTFHINRELDFGILQTVQIPFYKSFERIKTAVDKRYSIMFHFKSD